MPARKIAKVSRAEALSAIEAIGERRAGHVDELGHRREDPDLGRYSDDPVELLDFVCSSQRVPDAVLRADVCDALRVLEYVRKHVPALPDQLNHWEYTLLTTGKRVGLSGSVLARALGLPGRQAVRARILRHESAMKGLPRSERALLEARKAEARRREREAPERAWLRRHGLEMRDSAAELVEYGDALREAGLAEELYYLQLALADLAVWPDEQQPGYLTRTRSLNLHLRALLAEVPRPAVLGVPEALISRLRGQAAAHDRVICRSRS